MQPVAFFIPGKPFAKQRARSGFNPHLKRVVTYDTEGNVSFERQVGLIARPLFPAPLTGAVRLTVTACFKPAASHSKRKRAAMVGTPHTQKPDADNLVKSIKDGLNRVAWGDDSQVAELHARKVWGEEEGTSIIVEAMNH